MADTRFYEALGPVAAETLAAGFAVFGDGAMQVASVAPFGEAANDTLSYLDGKWDSSRTGINGCVIAPAAAREDLLAAGARAVIVADAPRAAFARLAEKLFRLRAWDVAGAPPQVELGAQIAPSAVLGPGCHIGAGTVVAPLAVIGAGVSVGRNCMIGPHATVMCALVGDHVTIGASAVIGERGFGVTGDASGLVDVPHLGRVIVQDRASIGAATTIDRGMLSDTVVGEDAKIDNLCQIAHNVRVGRNVVIAAFGGISGSTVVGDGARLGGRVGVADHRVIGERASLAAGSAVMHDVPDGETWGGYPAQPLRAWMRETAWIRRALRKGDGRD